MKMERWVVRVVVIQVVFNILILWIALARQMNISDQAVKAANNAVAQAKTQAEQAKSLIEENQAFEDAVLKAMGGIRINCAQEGEVFKCVLTVPKLPMRAPVPSVSPSPSPSHPLPPGCDPSGCRPTKCPTPCP